jgi:hypothetical protein
MALPDRAEQWPPEAHHPVYTDYEVWDAWYSGNVDALEMLYSTTRLTQTTGVWGQVKRFFMGSPNPGQQGQRPVKLHVPVPSEIARMSSAILYGEMVKVRVDDPVKLDNDAPGENTDAPKTVIVDPVVEAQNNRLADLLDDGVHAVLLEGGELSAALSGVFLRVSWDQSVVPDKPFLTAVAPDGAVPEFRFGRLAAVTFWADLAPIVGMDGTWKLLERHEPGTIEWGLYNSKSTGALGTRYPLTEHPSTAPLAAIVNQDAQVETGSDLLTAVYIPNIKPNRSRRKDPVAQNLGRSDFDAVEPLFDALDETYTSWMRDIRLGKARVLIDRQMLDVGKPGEGSMFNADREVFTNIEGGLQSGSGNGTPPPITQVQFKIRVTEHSETASNLLTRIFSAAGYSPQTFGEAGPNAVRTITATEVDSREKMTMQTRGAKIMYARPQLQHIFAALADVDAYVFHGPGRGDKLPDVEFPDAAAPSMDALATTLQLLRAAELLSDETGVEMLHPDWDQIQVQDEVKLLQAAKAAANPPMPDPMFLNGDAHGPAGADPTGTAGEPASNG